MVFDFSNPTRIYDLLRFSPLRTNSTHALHLSVQHCPVKEGDAALLGRLRRSVCATPVVKVVLTKPPPKPP